MILCPCCGFRTLQQNGGTQIFGWFFGHEHCAVIYDDKVTGYKARLIGNGAIPHDVQSEVKPDEDAPRSPT
jgi:hypothetical protein